MRILLTGCSSFTGFWFARALAAEGHHIVAPLLREKKSYEGLRTRRIAALDKIVELVEACPFGSSRFLELAAQGPWDRLCHHAAQVGDYRNPAFDVAGALAANTLGLPDVLRLMKAQGMQGVILTGSVFEPHEGTGTQPLRAFSPYGLSKAMTAETFRYWCEENGLPLCKFVIPNPFGPYEEPRFCSYLIRTWRDGKIAEVKTPSYIRDNIHIDLLALAYVQATTGQKAGFTRSSPSGYVESQGAFTLRFAGAMKERLGLECKVNLLEQTEFTEPYMRVNTENTAAIHKTWAENKAWDNLAAYYKEQTR